jgi:hypothetical protein
VGQYVREALVAYGWQQPDRMARVLRAMAPVARDQARAVVEAAGMSVPRE